jgi:hypothetical protein
MLRRTSKRVKEVVNKMRLPAVVRLSSSFWDDARSGTERAKRQLVLRQLAAMTVPHHHTPATALSYETGVDRPVDIPQFKFQSSRDREACRSAGAVPGAGAPQSLCSNSIGAGGAERLAGVLAQCTALAHFGALACNEYAALSY